MISRVTQHYADYSRASNEQGFRNLPAKQYGKTDCANQNSRQIVDRAARRNHTLLFESVGVPRSFLKAPMRMSGLAKKARIEATVIMPTPHQSDQKVISRKVIDAVSLGVSGEDVAGLDEDRRRG